MNVRSPSRFGDDEKPSVISGVKSSGLVGGGMPASIWASSWACHDESMSTRGEQ